LLRCLFVHVVVNHFSLCMLSLVMIFVVVNHITVVMSNQQIIDFIETISLQCYHVLLGLLHHMIRFCSLCVKFLNQ
jgi:hypothetical protein